MEHPGFISIIPEDADNLAEKSVRSRGYNLPTVILVSDDRGKGEKPKWRRYEYWKVVGDQVVYNKISLPYYQSIKNLFGKRRERTE